MVYLFFVYIMDEMNNDKIKSAVIKFEALQKEYEVTLQQYQES